MPVSSQPLTGTERQRRHRWRRRQAVTIVQVDLLPKHIERLQGRRLISPEDADDPEKLAAAILAAVDGR